MMHNRNRVDEAIVLHGFTALNMGLSLNIITSVYGANKSEHLPAAYCNLKLTVCFGVSGNLRTMRFGSQSLVT